MKRTLLMKLAGILVAVGTAVSPIVAEARGIVVEIAPPAPRVEVVPAEPFAGAIWAPGYWAWRGRQHVWVDGHYMRARRGYDYRPDGWERHGNGWKYHRGGWHRHRH